MTQESKLKNKREINILVSAGPTREPIDQVRYISNMSTGATGIIIAKESFNRGYDTELLLGPGEFNLEENNQVKVTRFITTNDLLNLVLEKIKKVNIYISTAAVADYSPIIKDEKIPSGKEKLTIKLYPTPKVIKIAKQFANYNTIFVAFKLNYNLSEEELIEKAKSSYDNIADIIVVNDLRDVNQTITSHKAIILFKGNIYCKVNSNEEIAKTIFDIIGEIVI